MSQQDRRVNQDPLKQAKRPQTDIFDLIFNSNLISSTQNDSYPPTNFYVLEDKTNVLEFALAGWSPEDLSITAENEFLVVKGEVAKAQIPEQVHFIQHGIAKRSWTRRYKMSGKISVKDIHCTFERGILSVKLKVQEPEETKFKFSINEL